MYDPILCMNVPDTVKSKDTRAIDTSFNVVYKSNSGTMQALVMAANEKEAEQKVRSREGSKFVSLIGVKKMSDSKTIDKAIRNCDTPNIKESLKQDIKSGKITIRQAAIEMYETGMFNWIPDENEVKRRLGL